MIVLWLVRCRETNISSATETKDSRMISAAKGSILVWTTILLHPRLDDQVADPVHAGSLAWVDRRVGGPLLDDGGSLPLFVEGQPSALVEGRLVNSVLIEVDLPPALGRGALRPFRGKRSQVRVGYPHQAGHVQVDELDGPIEPEHERALVALMEAGCHVSERRLPVGRRNADRVLLAGVTHVGRPCGDDVGRIEALVLEEQYRVAFELVVPPVDGAHGFIGGPQHRSAGEVLLVIRRQHAPRAEVARGRRDYDLAGVELASQCGGVHRAASTARDEG